MRGDFSTWNKEKDKNFNGVLHQQGRVLTDRDWNAQTEILNDWQQIAGQDIIGAGVAAVPADAPDSFKVTEAKVVGDKVEVSVTEGRVWADGLLVKLDEDVVREAEYLQPPIQDPAGQVSDLPNDVRDALILETWLEELNAFQNPELLIEPALGGVDTTERVQTAFRFRLFRMDSDDTCDSIIEDLKDDFDNKGRLTAVLQPDIAIDSDCPVVEGGGYTGFEHQLYRIEIAQTGKSEPHFKWSQFNGGLVGRGRFDVDKVIITANSNAILYSGLTNFYMETLEEINGYWQVTYGAKVTLDAGSGTLNLPAAPADVFFGAAPDTKTVFFRLWNDIRPVADFAAEAELQDGIRLAFSSTDSDKYTPHDFWTFPVRAGEISNDATLVDDEAPEGIFYHRVPLAELLWADAAPAESGAEIEDCRRIFQPLTRLKGCCTYRVGDGVRSHGDFKSIQKAIDALPADGGEVCVLPGNFNENVVITAPRNENITIKGCGDRSQVVGVTDDPVFHIKGGTNLELKSLSISATKAAVGVLLEGDEIVADGEESEEEFGLLRKIKLENLQIWTFERSGIEMHVGQFVTIHGCRIYVWDEDTEYAAVLLAGDDVDFEENEIRVISGEDIINDPLSYDPAQRAAGGLHLYGGCERVRVIDNLIIGGTGNGINLGNVDEMTEDGEIIKKYGPWHVGNDHDNGICDPPPGEVPDDETDDGTVFVAGDPLFDILIERNRILCMGRNGIGVDGFFGFRVSGGAAGDSPTTTLGKTRIELLSVVNLTIIGNTIHRCLNRTPADIRGAMTMLMGFGGISLSDVENLVVRDNFITENGMSFLDATCGIFVLHGEGTEISRNQIINNGMLTDEEATDSTVKNGMRGGVVVLFGTQPMAADSVQGSGIPVLFLRENVISVPMGRALTMMAMGDVSITGNRLMSQSIAPGFNLMNFMASHVLLFNLSVAISMQAAAGYKNVSEGKTEYKQMGAQAEQQPSPSAEQQNSLNIAAFRRKLISGSTLFAHNQCQLVNQKSDRGFFSALSSILIIGLDDVAFLSNQSNCSLVNDWLILDTFLFGMTVRANDNYWQEIPWNVIFSAVTLGVLNTTTDNQATHCILARGGLYLDRYNLVLLDFVMGLNGNVSNNEEPGACEKILSKMFPDFAKSTPAPG